MAINYINDNDKYEYTARISSFDATDEIYWRNKDGMINFCVVKLQNEMYKDGWIPHEILPLIRSGRDLIYIHFVFKRLKKIEQIEQIKE